MGLGLTLQNYIPFVDICVVLLSLVYAWLLESTYTMRKLNLYLFRAANLCVLVVALCRVVYHDMLNHLSVNLIPWVCVLRATSYILLAFTFMCFCIYVINLVELSKAQIRCLSIICISLWVIYAVWEVTGGITKLGFYITEDLEVHHSFFVNGFNVIYVIYLVFILIFLARNRRKFISGMYNCLAKIMALCTVIAILEFVFETSSFLTVTFSLPIMAVLFLFHSNSYDPDTGTLDDKAFGFYISDLKNKEFTLLCLKLVDMKQENLEEFSNEFFHFNEEHFNDSCIFRFGTEHLIMVYEKTKNLKAVFVMPLLMDKLYELYEKYQMDYKMITIHSSPEMKTGDDYLALNDFLERKVKMNTSYECDHDDVVAYLNANYIVGQLHDIVQGNNLDDERVLVYCQPVYNTSTNSFTTAEALMRLKLEDTGMIYPDVFIPLAEKYDFIHFLSMVILNKTCKKVRQLIDEGYFVDRISVNFAMSELRDSKFCDEVKKIIESNDIPFDKIALELTESMNEAEFGHVQSVMKTLHEVGMKFYLDDFGTGYSNFERIMKLPIDIIKFDRSLTIVAVNDASSRDMVVGFTDIFKRANYKILFEGVEDETDEKQCIEMSALYLQGYKYSRPIPIDELDGFLQKKNDDEKEEPVEKTEESEKEETAEKAEESEKEEAAEKTEESEKEKAIEKAEESEKEEAAEKAEESEKEETTEKVGNSEKEEMAENVEDSEDETWIEEKAVAEVEIDNKMNA